MKFVETWGKENTALYLDPPYVAETRSGDCYKHEMDDDHHRRLAAVVHGAVAQGAKVAISGYASALYDELFVGWRTVRHDVALHGARDGKGARRTEVLWCSYPETEALGYREKRQGTLF